MIFVSSWDDGHPLDERVANMLLRYGLKGSFYVPIRNCEGRAVMSTSLVRSLDCDFEIGSHTLDHFYLTGLSEKDCEIQIKVGKQELEMKLGHEVKGFCYPGGKMNSRIRQLVIDSGFSHARTINNLWLDAGLDPFSVCTTAQVYPHRAKVLWRNYLRGGHYVARFTAFRMLTKNGWLGSMMSLVDKYAGTDCVLHLWGHSWEIDKLDLWSDIDVLFKHIASLGPKCLDVNELVGSQF